MGLAVIFVNKPLSSTHVTKSSASALAGAVAAHEVLRYGSGWCLSMSLAAPFWGWDPTSLISGRPPLQPGHPASILRSDWCPLFVQLKCFPFFVLAWQVIVHTLTGCEAGSASRPFLQSNQSDYQAHMSIWVRCCREHKCQRGEDQWRDEMRREDKRKREREGDKDIYIYIYIYRER